MSDFENLLLCLFSKYFLIIYFVLDTASSTVDFTWKEENLVHPQEPMVKWETADELHGTGSYQMKYHGKSEWQRKIIWETTTTTREVSAWKLAPRKEQL